MTDSLRPDCFTTGRYADSSHPGRQDPLAGALRERLAAVGYQLDEVVDLLGESAHAALGRNETTPGMLALGPLSAYIGDDHARATMTQLWVLQRPVTLTDFTAALGDVTDAVLEAGLVQLDGSWVQPRAAIKPYAVDDQNLFLVGDLIPGLDGAQTTVRPDYVLGVSPAASSLAHQTVRRRVRRVLDLGTGCGIQALHLLTHCDEVVATDVNPRALAMTRFNALLNDVDIDVRAGSLFDPVAGEEFDLIVTNPPFVISPSADQRLTYRDAGMDRDDVMRQVVAGMRTHLAPDGVGQILGNWAITRDERVEERLGQWCSGLDAWIIERERLDPASYAEVWLKDAGIHPATGGDLMHYRTAYERWLTWFDAQGIEAVGFGWLQLSRPTTGAGTFVMESWPYEVEQPIGHEIEASLSRQRALRQLDDATLLSQRLVLRSDVEQVAQGSPGAEDPATIVLRQQRGFRRAEQVDTVMAAFAGACDGDLQVGQIFAALAQLLDQTDVADTHLKQVRRLVGEGYLTLDVNEA